MAQSKGHICATLNAQEGKFGWTRVNSAWVSERGVVLVLSMALLTIVTGSTIECKWGGPFTTLLCRPVTRGVPKTVWFWRKPIKLYKGMCFVFDTMAPKWVGSGSICTWNFWGCLAHNDGNSLKYKYDLSVRTQAYTHTIIHIYYACMYNVCM